MLEIDLHVHSLFSSCGLHTILELIMHAKELGMKGIAITDHGPTLGGRLSSPFFDRLRSFYDGIVVYKGIETNILDNDGTIDIPGEYLPNCDVILLGIHHNITRKLSPVIYTDMLIMAIEKNPCIDIITHPNDTNYPLDYTKLCRAAAKFGVALELNNSRTLYRRSSDEETLKLINDCIESGCKLAVTSDTHAIHELGDDSAVTPLLELAKFPDELLVTKNTEKVKEFLMPRKKNKCS
jgi:putative hydrolase